MNNKLIVNNLDDLPALGQKILNAHQPSAIFLLHGHLGAGKTTFVQSLANLLNVKERMTSPTFNIMNEYQGIWNHQQVKVIHMDCFRMEPGDTAPDIDFIEFNNTAFYAFIEWPEKININWHNWDVPVISIEISIPNPENTNDISKSKRQIIWNEQN